MPKEIITQGNPDTEPYVAVVGWQRDCDVQLGIQVADADNTLLDMLYGGRLDNLEFIGERLLEWLNSDAAGMHRTMRDFTTSDQARNAHQRLGAEVLGWVEKSRYPQERDGIWVSMTRSGINTLIRNLRKARDLAYGRDE